MRSIVPLLLFTMLLPFAPPAQASVNRQAPAADPIADAAPGAFDPALQGGFDAVWQRADLAVQLGEAARAWTWGPEFWVSGLERYAQSPDGLRWVQYFDKARLELNNRADPGAVSAGLLVREMVGGLVALGDDPAQVEPLAPAEIPVAGDVPSLVDTPGYASFGPVTSLFNDRRAEPAIGGQAAQTLDRAGSVGVLPPDVAWLAGLVPIAAYDDRLGHNLPAPFLSFLNRSGTVYEAGAPAGEHVLYAPWEAVAGLPITEAYWFVTTVGGQPAWVLAQLFERRVLTFTPSNAPEYQVEMGNAGRHYWEWRYGRPPAAVDLLRVEPAPRELSPNSALVAWTATEPVRASIVWGTRSDALDAAAGGGDPLTEAAVTLPELLPGTRYFWRVLALDSVGTTRRSPLATFTTPGLPPPPIQPSPAPGGNIVCLTFDDGPLGGTAEVLDVLGGRVPATFFLVGANGGGLQASLVPRMLNEGHQIGNHTFSHVPMTKSGYLNTYGDLSDPNALAAFQENYYRNERHFNALLGSSGRVFHLARLPGDGRAVQINGRYVYVEATNAMGLVHVGWNMEFAPNGVFSHVPYGNWHGIVGLAATSPNLPVPGSILLLHDATLNGRTGLLAALIGVLANNGYGFGRVNGAGGCG